jgi:hypothetical protein
MPLSITGTLVIEWPKELLVIPYTSVKADLYTNSELVEKNVINFFLDRIIKPDISVNLKLICQLNVTGI